MNAPARIAVVRVRRFAALRELMTPKLPPPPPPAASADTKPTALAALYENDGNHAKRKKKVNYQNNSLHGLETLVLKLPIRTLLWPDRAKI